MRLGIFGGSFDPPHVGHFLAAVDAAEQLALDRLLWVPVAQQPLKIDAPHHATPNQRYRMVAAAAAAYPIFEPSRIEIDRDGLSYTVTTMEALAQAYPTAERIVVIGQDACERFAAWHQPERIRTLARIAVIARSHAQPHLGAGNPSVDPDRWVCTRLVEVSATEVRARVRAGQPIRGFVQDAVAALIESEGLYRW